MTNFLSLTDLGLAGSSSQLLSDWLTQMQLVYPGYSPSASNLEYIQAQIFASHAADLAQLCSQGATELFRAYAVELVGVPYQQGTAAQALVALTPQANPATLATLSAALNTGGGIVSIPVIALTYGIAAGTIVITDPTLAHTQTWTMTAASAGDTQLSVSSQTPNFAYPVGSVISGGTALQTYSLPALSQFNLDSLGFVNLAPQTVTAGTSLNVTLTAVQTGQIFNGAGSGGLVEAIQQLPWLTSTAIVTSATGGIDPEDDAHYLNRVKVALQLQAPRPVTAVDFGTMALNFSPYPGTDQQEVGRATSVDGYNPVDLSTGNPRMVAVCVTDANGFALNSDTLYGYVGGTSTNVILTVPNPTNGWGIAGWLQSLREITFVVNVISPTYSPIYVTVTVKAATGWDSTSVAANVQSALLGYLSPQAWGLPPSSQIGWQNTTTIFKSALVSVVQRTAGVDHIVDDTLKVGTALGTVAAADLALTGPVALPTSSILTIPTSQITVT